MLFMHGTASLNEKVGHLTPLLLDPIQISHDLSLHFKIFVSSQVITSSFPCSQSCPSLSFPHCPFFTLLLGRWDLSIFFLHHLLTADGRTYIMHHHTYANA